MKTRSINSVWAMGLLAAFVMLSAASSIRADVPTTPQEMNGFVGKLIGTIKAVHGSVGFVMTVDKAIVADESTVKDASMLVGTDVWLGCVWLKGDSGNYEPESNSWDVWKDLKKDTKVKCVVMAEADKNGKVLLHLARQPKILDDNAQSPATRNTEVPPIPKAETPANSKAEVPTTPKEMDGFVGSLTGPIKAVHGKFGFIMTVEQAVVADESTVKDASRLVGADVWIGCVWNKGDSGEYEPESLSWDVWKDLKHDDKFKCVVKTSAAKDGKVTFVLVKAPKKIDEK